MAKIVTGLGNFAILALYPEPTVTETLSWLTDVSNSYDGTEESKQIRDVPRRSFKYNMYAPPEYRADAMNTVFGALREDWAVPVWSEGQYIGALASSASSITCDTDLYDLRDDSLALVYESKALWTVVRITTVGSGSVSISGSVGATFTAAELYPIRIGRIRGDSIRRSNGLNDMIQVTYDLDDNVDLGSTPPTQFLSYDVNFDRALFVNGSLDTNVTAQQNLADFDVGMVEQYAPWLHNRNVASYMLQSTNPTEYRAMLNFLYRRAGKYRKFWQPTFENDLRVTNTGMITTTLTFKKDSFQDWSAQQRLHVAFQDRAGTWYPRTLSSISSVSSTEYQATLSSSLGVTAANILRCSYLSLKRLTNDDVDLNWVGNGVAQATISVTEVQP